MAQPINSGVTGSVPYRIAPRGKGWLLKGTLFFSLRCKPDAPEDVRITAAICKMLDGGGLKRGMDSMQIAALSKQGA